MNEWVVSLSYGELILKGKNRGAFIAALKRHLHKAIAGIPVREEFEQFGKLFLAVDEDDVKRTVAACRNVFGLLYVTPSRRVAKNPAEIRRVAAELLSKKLDASPENQTFKVKVHRSDKSFPMTSPEFAGEIGHWMLQDVPGLRVQMKEPDLTLQVEIREDAFVSVDRFPGMGGLPAGSGGRGLLLLSGGIDSPAAGFQMARRGLSIGALHFHSYPFTSERAQDKALRLARQMERFVGPVRFYMVNLQGIYTEIAKNCDRRNTTVLSRRMMMRIADRIADRDGYDALITGESLGQVASQTIQGIDVVNAASEHPILRPFIATDKSEIIEIARRIGTYELSIEPFDDCCSIFAPDHPNTRPRRKEVEADEAKLDVEALVESALETLDIIQL